ncbi:MAG TPA: hypothetical protein V6D17_09125 [Candidatus Obscuribacterales bacterium]
MEQMLLADTMAIFFVVVGLLLAFPGLWLLCRGLWPQHVEAVSADCRNGLLVPFLVGLPITALAFLGVVSSGGKNGSIGDLTALAILTIYMVYANAGVSGIATLLGERLPSPADKERPWRATVRGGIILELSYLLPFVGWFLIWPVSLTIGCGSATRSLMRRKSKRAASKHGGKSERDVASSQSDDVVGASA